MATWDPEQYRRFERERNQPLRDLLARVEHDSARRVVDVGCGPGNSTELLARRFVGAEITGFDGSEAMVEQARKRLPGVSFACSDVRDWVDAHVHRRAWDVVLSNATLHWLDDHPSLFPKLFDCVADGGVLAVQMPRNYGALTHSCLREIARREPWADRVKSLVQRFPVHEPGIYHDLLAPLASELSVWETLYLHAFDSADAIVEWMSGAALRPYFDALDPTEREEFLEAYRNAIDGAYPPRSSGQVLMDYRRLFVVAKR